MGKIICQNLNKDRCFFLNYYSFTTLCLNLFAVLRQVFAVGFRHFLMQNCSVFDHTT